MKKRINIFVLLMVSTAMVSGCGFTDDIVENCKNQREWTQQNHATTNGQDLADDVDDILDEISGDDTFNEVSNTSTTSESGEFAIGDTVAMTNTNDDGTTTKLNITLTGCQAVYNGMSNVTAISYTVVNADDERTTFYSNSFDCYADSMYVEQTFWNDYDPYTFVDLIPGTAYEGCFIADVDLSTVSEIKLCAGDAIWDVQGAATSSTPQMDETVADKCIKYAGLYGDDSNNIDINLYSGPSPTDEYIGNLKCTLADGSYYAGELKYGIGQSSFYLICQADDGYEIQLTFEPDGDSYSVNVFVILPTSGGYDAGTFPLIRHYES